MCGTQCVVALLALAVGLAHCFSWDIVLMSQKNGIEFYENETLTHSEQNFTQNRIAVISYDPGHNRVLFTSSSKHDFASFVYSFDITTRKLEHLVSSIDEFIETFTYDLVTETLFWLQGKSIYSYSLKPGSMNEVNGNFLTKIDGTWPHEFVVDSCGGFIYWIYPYRSIKRSRLNGDHQELIIDSHDNVRNYLCGLTIDQHTRKLYWIADDFDTDPRNYTFSLKSADLDGRNIRTLYEIKTKSSFCLLAVSKDFIYWGSKRTSKDGRKSYWQLEKNPPRDLEVSPIEISTTAYSYMAIAANNKIEDQIEGIQDCEALKGQIPEDPPHDVEPIQITNKHYMDITTNYKIEDQTQGIEDSKTLKGLLPSTSSVKPLNVTEDAGLLCVHGTQVSGESVCECAQGYSGERCEVSVCQNYCVRGDCSVSAEGLPTCRCNTGYTGDKCDVTRCSGDCPNNGACWSRDSVYSTLIISMLLAIQFNNMNFKSIYF